MKFEEFEKSTIFEYWKTLLRKDILNINNNIFLKKPYLENYIIHFSSILDENILINNILQYSNESINGEEILFLINNNIELNSDEKKKLDIFFLKDISNEEVETYNQISIEIILYQIKYFRFYQIISELLFDNDNDINNELYNFILIYIKNNKNDIKKYIKINFKFKIFYYYICKLSQDYNNFFKLLINKNFLNNYDKKEINNLFLKNLFTHWYNIYKKDLLDNKVCEKTQNFVNKSILSRILCMPNI